MAYILSLLLIFLNRALVDTTAFVDEVTSGGGLTRIHVPNHDNVNVCLFDRHALHT